MSSWSKRIAAVAGLAVALGVAGPSPVWAQPTEMQT